MPKNVLTMPVRESSIFAHKYGVYSIQENRHDVEPLCQDPNQYLALRESTDHRRGAMLWLYQVVSAPSLQLDPVKSIPEQIKKWHEGLRDDKQKLSREQQMRLSDYASAIRTIMKDGKPDDAYKKVQRFYVLGPWQNDKAAGNASIPPLGRLIRGPRPFKNDEHPQRYALEDVCRMFILPKEPRTGA